MAKTNRDNLCGAKVCELVSVSHIDFADYHVVMHASSLRALLSNIEFIINECALSCVTFCVLLHNQSVILIG